MTAPKYPVYVISKGRWGAEALTARFLISDGVDFRLVVEPQEVDEYVKTFGRDRLLVLPFSNLGLGSVPARNWCWEHAIDAGHERHWILDDNILKIERRWKTVRIACDSGPAFRACEMFVDRYENISVAGMNYHMFAMDGRKAPPFFLNCHVYSCLLIKNDIQQRWRGRYNEDTDLCLQVLSAGQCTVLINAFLAYKMVTMTMKGGNATELYKGDGRLKMARSLERVWPGVVETKRRFQRPQHVVKDAWKRFDTPLILKPGVVCDPDAKPNEYGMELVQVKPIKSAALREFVKDKLVVREPVELREDQSEF